MAIKLSCKLQDEEVLDELQEIEQDEEEEKLQEFEDRIAWEESILDSMTYPVEYCPECGDNRYQTGDSCLSCDFPHKDDNKFSELDFLDRYWI